MSRRVPTGLGEVEPPTKAPSKPPVYADERLDAILRQLGSGKWLTNHEVYHSRSAAYHHCNVLMSALLSHPRREDVLKLKAKTWGSGEEYRWAIRKE